MLRISPFGWVITFSSISRAESCGYVHKSRLANLWSGLPRSARTGVVMNPGRFCGLVTPVKGQAKCVVVAGLSPLTRSLEVRKP